MCRRKIQQKETMSPIKPVRLMLQILENDIRPSDLGDTALAGEFALAASAATAGSTNSILHCLAFGREAGSRIHAG